MRRGHFPRRSEAGVASDIAAAVEWLRKTSAAEHVDLIGTSFAGGVCALFCVRHPSEIRRLVLFNPLLDYKKRFVDDKPYWHAGSIDAGAGVELAANGYLPHSPTFKLGRALLNEVFYLRPNEELRELTTPTRIFHGTGDTFVPIDSSRHYVKQIPADAEFIEIDGAQHGFAVHDDPSYQDPQSCAWQTSVIEAVAAWLST